MIGRPLLHKPPRGRSAIFPGGKFLDKYLLIQVGLNPRQPCLFFLYFIYFLSLICFNFTVGKMPYLLDLMNSRTHGAGLAEEIWWLFTFLTAKEDEVVNVLLEQGLVQVRA